jgi:hypothetical protein
MKESKNWAYIGQRGQATHYLSFVFRERDRAPENKAKH